MHKKSSLPISPSTTVDSDVVDLSSTAAKLNLAQTTHHIFLCAEPRKPNCCNAEAGKESWDYLKKRVNELTATPMKGKSIVVQRSKADCLRICRHGPIMVIYPEGVWYHSCSPTTIERILQEHVLEGRIVEEFRIASPQA